MGEPEGKLVQRSWFVLQGLIRILSYTTQEHLPRVGMAHSGLGPLTLIINQTIHMLAYRPI